jgi:hypothetical protein
VRLASFTQAQKGTPIHINPINVVTILEGADGTLIITNATGSRGAYSFYVTESIDDAFARINSAMKD